MGQNAIAGAIAGAIIGVLACLTTIGILYWFYFRGTRRRRQPLDLFGLHDEVAIPSGDHKSMPVSPDIVLTLQQKTIVAATQREPTSRISIVADATFTDTLNLGTTSNRRGRLLVANPEPQTKQWPGSTPQPQLDGTSTQVKESEVSTADSTAVPASALACGDASQAEVGHHPYSSGLRSGHQHMSTPDHQAHVETLTEQLSSLQAHQVSQLVIEGPPSEPPPDYFHVSGSAGFPFAPEKDRKT